MSNAVLNKIVLSSDEAFADSEEAYLDPKSFKDIMVMLTNLYPDPDLAIIREYSTNAYDSHVESGQTRPIEVTLPSSHDPHFRVQDWGVGLSPAGMSCFIAYGTSTKREREDVHGQAGLGCKSAMTIVDSFQAIGVKDGIKTYALIFKNGSGVPERKIMGTEETSEPNGVTIVVPVEADSIDSYEGKAAQVFRMWPEGSVLVNGKAPATPKSEGYQQVGDLGWLSPTRSYYGYGSGENLSVNMGGIVYRVDGLGYDKANYMYQNAKPLQNHKVILNLPLRAVGRTPSREAVLLDNRSRRTLAKALEKMYQYLVRNGQAEVDKAENAYAAIEVIDSYTRILPLDLAYQGQKYEEIFRFPTGFEMFAWRNGRRYSGGTAILTLPQRLRNESVRGNKNTAIFDTHGIEDKKLISKIVTRLTGIRAITPFLQDATVVMGDFTNIRKTNIFVDAIATHSDNVRVYDAAAEYDALLEYEREERAANRIPRTATQSAPRSAVTYKVYTVGEDGVSSSLMTISEMRNLTSAYVLYEWWSPSRSHYNYSLSSVVEQFGKVMDKGTNLIIVPNSRKVEVLKRRLADHVELETLGADFAKTLKAQLVVPKQTLGSAVAYHLGMNKNAIQYIANSNSQIRSEALKSIVADVNDNQDLIRQNGVILQALDVLGADRMDRTERYAYLHTADDKQIQKKALKIADKLDHYKEALYIMRGYYYSDDAPYIMVRILLNGLYDEIGDAGVKL